MTHCGMGLISLYFLYSNKEGEIFSVDVSKTDWTLKYENVHSHFMDLHIMLSYLYICVILLLCPRSYGGKRVSSQTESQRNSEFIYLHNSR